MATDRRHAAWQQRSFAVRLVPEEGDATELAAGLTDLLDAVDLAAEWVEREDPGRDGARRLAIFETRDGVSQKVWDYPPLPTERQLVDLFGFDPVSWKSAVPEYSTAKRTAPTPPPPRPRFVAQPRPPAPAPLDVEAARAPRPELRTRVVTVAQASWGDRASRYCLLLAALALWLALTLTDPAPLVVLVVAAGGLWWRRDRRAAARADADDWL